MELVAIEDSPSLLPLSSRLLPEEELEVTCRLDVELPDFGFPSDVIERVRVSDDFSVLFDDFRVLSALWVIASSTLASLAGGVIGVVTGG